jgi:uncharacterized protein involved in exopolysaccharide biosynthesis
LPELSSYPPRLDTQESPPLTFPRWVAGIVVRWRLVVAVSLGILALAGLSLVLVPPSYRARGSFVANSSSASKLGGAMGGGVSALGGLATQLGISPNADPSESPGFYHQLLNSRELLSRLLLSRFLDPRTENRGDSATFLDILEVRGEDQHERLERAVKRLEAQLRSDFDQKTSIVELYLDTRWPELSAAVINRAVDLVASFNRQQRSSTVRSKRLYLGDRVAEARTQLQQAEDELRYFYDQNRSWRTSPGLVFAEQQHRRRGDVATDLYLALQRQYDAARLEELNSAALITVLDSAVVPHKPQWPRYGTLFGSAIVLGGLAGTIVAGAAAVLDDWRQRNPDGARSFHAALAQASHEIGSTLRRRRRRRVA